MSEEAKRKASTASRQARHAVANVAEAAELQSAEVAQGVVESAPLRSPMVQNAVRGAVIGVASIGAYVGVQRAITQFKTKRAEKKLTKEGLVKEGLKATFGDKATHHIDADNGDMI